MSAPPSIGDSSKRKTSQLVLSWTFLIESSLLMNSTHAVQSYHGCHEKRRAWCYEKVSYTGSVWLMAVQHSNWFCLVPRGFMFFMGPLGRDKTLDLIYHRFCWPGMAKDVEAHITNCERCVKKKSPDHKASMVPIVVGEPMELLAIYFFIARKRKRGLRTCVGGD